VAKSGGTPIRLATGQLPDEELLPDDEPLPDEELLPDDEPLPDEELLPDDALLPVPAKVSPSGCVRAP